MRVQLIVAEKPSVARDLARVLGVRAAGSGAFEGPTCVITWCVGHLVELDEPAAYDPRWKRWRLDTLPMLPAEFRLRPARHAAAQLRVVVRLMRERRFTSVVNACDAGREGELIFRYLRQYAGGGAPVRRLWISSLTDEAIRRGFAALRPGAQLDPLADAARARSEADWLVGMNATRAITARGRASGGDALYSIGRVQTPTLAMLVQREQAIAAFVPRAYWEVRGDFTTGDGARVAARWRHGATGRLGTAALAAAIVARDQAHAQAADPVGPRVERVRARTVREPPPLLFDLTSLQRTANKRFGWSAARTLELAQALYERHKLLTYPRTDSRHLTTDVVAELPALFAALGQVPVYAPFVAPLVASPPRPGRRIVDDGKVHDHHAIIPTGKVAGVDALDRDLRRLFDLVVRRFLGAFHPDAEIALTEVWIRVGPGPAAGEAVGAQRGGERIEAARAGAGGDAGGGGRGGGGGGEDEVEEEMIGALPAPPDRYVARGRVRVVAGWQAVAGIDAGDGGDGREGGDGASLPALTVGQSLDGRFAAQGKQTTPPPRYTEATLLGAMESAGKAIDDEALRLAMKDCGLGTPATRAAVIETLLRRGYVVRDRQHLRPTALGVGLIAALPVASLASPELTGTWEARLARIARGEESRAAFMADIARYVTEMVDAIRAAAPPSGSPSSAARPAGDGHGNGAADDGHGNGADAGDRDAVTGPRAASRRARDRDRGSKRRGASRSGPRTSSPNALSAGPQGRSRRAAPPSPNAPSAGPQGRSRRAAPPSPPSPNAPSAGPRGRSRRAAPRAADAIAATLTCPRCKAGPLITGARGWGCSRWREGCGFVVWFVTAGRALTGAQLRELVTRGRTRKARFVAAGGDEVEGRLVLDDTAPGGAARLEPVSASPRARSRHAAEAADRNG